ncbi:MAG: CapA family protein [Eggerthellaceae bacterium]|nr:CapA family protein [Eggerthellaceae bacterium]
MGESKSRDEARARLEARRARSGSADYAGRASTSAHRAASQGSSSRPASAGSQGAPSRSAVSGSANPRSAASRSAAPGTANPRSAASRTANSGSAGISVRPTAPERSSLSLSGDRRKGPNMRLIALIAIVLALALVVFLAVRACSSDSDPNESGEPANSQVLPETSTNPSASIPEGSVEAVDANGVVHGTTPDGVKYTVVGRGESSAQAGKVTLIAAGDQLATDDLLTITDANAGSVGDGEYDFRPLYKEVKPLIQAADIAFVNQETVMAGEEEYDYSGWPSFNTPDAAAEALSYAGFDLVNFGTNHTYDYYTYGVEQSFKVWEQYPELVIGGSYPTQEDRDTVHMIERDGMTFAFLAYCYGDNYLGSYENFPNQYYVCGFDKTAMETEIKRAQTVADVVIVAMHWGTEYVVEPNDQQIEYAKFLADLDVDLVLGTHAHIMQPTKYVTGDSGNAIPVVFGLSDFVSGWTKTNYILSGLFTCEFTRAEGGGVDVSGLTWYPTIEWSDGNETYVRLLKDMDEETTNANTRTLDVEDDYTYLRDFVNASGMEIPVVM